MQRILSVIILLVVLASCHKWDDYRDLVPGGETRYPGIDSAITYAPGSNRVLLSWRPTPDPTVTGFIIYWNNKSDSLTIPSKSVKPEDTIRTIVPNLPEGAYSFIVHAFDAKGNRSVARIVNSAKTYGTHYINNLYNRSLSASKPGEYLDNGALRLYFSEPDTINIRTEVRYLDLQQQWRSAFIAPAETSVDLPEFLANSKFAYRSGYIPARDAIDTFYVSRYDSAVIAR